MRIVQAMSANRRQGEEHVQARMMTAVLTGTARIVTATTGAITAIGMIISALA
jgi:hypothetical protein